MSSVNPDALNVLTSEQAREACRIIDEIGHVSNGLGASEAAHKLNKARTDLKSLFVEINDDHCPVIQ